MTFKKILPVLLALFVAAALAVLTATLSVSAIENRSERDVEHVLNFDGHNWATVKADGLQVILSGEAADEATRFSALSAAGRVIDSMRLVDMMEVAKVEALKPPRFSIEILRNEDGISLIGLVPKAMDRQSMVRNITAIADNSTVTDLLNVADYPAPATWDSAIEYGILALADLPRSKISVSADLVTINAISDSAAEKRTLESDLSRNSPPDVKVALSISAPRPVITPFTLRFLIDAEGARFDACSTDTEQGRVNILKAASAAGLQGKATCTIGLGVPTPTWDRAVTTGITKLAELGGGSITFSDADVTVVALENTPLATFDKVIGELEAALPEVFSLHAILPDPVQTGSVDSENVIPEFIATRNEDGLVELRGRIANERARIATESFAKAQFGSNSVTGAMRIDEQLPRGWSTRVLASLEALSFLNSGQVTAQPTVVTVSGVTGAPDARAEISRLLSEKLGEAEDFRISVSYEKKLDPELDLPTAEECVQKINLVLGVRQITFAPGSAEIDNEASDSIEKIVEIMQDCWEFPMEIGGHTDSQGREVMNQELSKSRADAVLAALLQRRVLTKNLTAKGYGETEPVADNDTEAGRELNRRIAFKLILPEEEDVAATDDASPSHDPTTETQESENADEQN